MIEGARCSVCGTIYDPRLGEPRQHIPQGTPFEQLPDSFNCEVCGATKQDFEPAELPG